MNLQQIKTVLKDSLKDKNKLQLIGAGLITSLVVLLLYFFILLRPQLNSLKKYRLQAETLRKDIANASRLVSNLENIRQQRNALSGKIKGIEQKIPGEKEISLLLEHISNMAKESGVEVTGLEPGKEADKPDQSAQVTQGQQDNSFSEVFILIRAKCGYHQLGKFVNKIENSGIMKIREFEVKSSSADKYNKCSVKISVSMVVRREE